MSQMKVTVRESDALAASHGGIYLGEADTVTKPYSTTTVKGCKWRCSAGHHFSATHKTVQQGIWCPTCKKIREGKQAGSLEGAEQESDTKPELQGTLG